MDLRLLRTFVDVADTGSVTAAARRTGYSQPALSHQLCVLERLLDRRLFDRSPAGMCLTVDGAALYPYARVVVTLLEELCRGKKMTAGIRPMQNSDSALNTDSRAS